MTSTLKPTHRVQTARPSRRKQDTLRHQSAEGVSKPTQGDVLTQRANVMLPAQLLQPGEIIILLIKPSPWFIILEPLRTLAAIAAATLILASMLPWLGFGYTAQQIYFVGSGLIALRLFWQFLEWLSRVYMLTDQRVVAVAGVLRVHVFQTSLDQIQHTDLLFSVRERFFGLGTLIFSTAGSATAEAAWQMISNPLDIHQQVIHALKRYRR